jgi:hypothetical protein
MDAKTAAVPAATTTEGTVIYCTTPGTDTVSLQTVNANRTDVQEVQTVLFFIVNGTACDPDGGSFVVTYAGEAGDAIAHDANVNGTVHAAAINSNANISGVTVTSVAGNVGFVITFPANTGDHPMVTVANTGLQDGGGGALVCATGANTITETTKGVSGVTFDFIDDDLTNNSFVTIKTVGTTTGVNATAGIPVLTTWYQRWTYDSTDTFATGTALADQGATEAGFETANAAIANLTTNVALTYRTGATTSGKSHFSVGG